MRVCPECGIPHHAECWEENGGCTTFGCRAAPHRGPAPAPAAAALPGSAGASRVEVLSRSITVHHAPASRVRIGGCLTAAFAALVVGGTVAVLLPLLLKMRTPVVAVFVVMVLAAGLVRLMAGWHRWFGRW